MNAKVLLSRLAAEMVRRGLMTAEGEPVQRKIQS